MPLEILDAVHEEYNRTLPNTIKTFNTQFAGQNITDSAVPLDHFINIVERCLFLEKEIELEKIQRFNEDEKRKKMIMKDKLLQYQHQLQVQLEHERNFMERARMRNRGDYGNVKIVNSGPSSSAARDTENSLRRSVSTSGRVRGNNRDRDSEFEGSDEVRGREFDRLRQREKEYSVCDSRAHAVAQGRSVSRGRPRSASVTTSKTRTASTGGRAGSRSGTGTGSRSGTGSGAGKGGSWSRPSSGVSGARGAGGGFLFGESSVSHPAVSQGMMKTRVGHYALRLKQSDKLQLQQQQRRWDMEDNEKDKPVLRSKANRAFKLRHAKAKVEEENPGGPSQYDRTHVHDHQAWIK